MKRIALSLVAATVVFMAFVACGEKPAETPVDETAVKNEGTMEAGMFENNAFKTVLPPGWTAEDYGAAAVFSSGSNPILVVKIAYNTDEAKTADSIAQELAKGLLVEDMAFGQYIYKQFVSKSGEREITNLVTVSGKTSVAIEASDVFDKDSFDIINSLTIK